MLIVKDGTIRLLFGISLLIGVAKFPIRAQSGSDPSQWLDAFNRSLCGHRSRGRPLIPPTFAPFAEARLAELDYGAYNPGHDYDTDQYGRRRWNTSDEQAARRHRASVGFDAMPGEVPWHAQLTLFYGWLGLYYHAFCGGVLIHRDLVLTAAHCIIDSEGWRAQRIWVRVGLYNWHEYEGRQWLGYSKYCLPKDYKPGQFKYDDIAVIRLDKSVEYDQFVQPTCLPGKMEPQERELCMTGGMGVFKESDGRTSRHLRVLPVSWCGRRGTPDIPSDQSCWITSDQVVYPGSLCRGDSGSGVYCPNEPDSGPGEQFTSMGVLSNTQIGDCNEGNIRYSFFSDLGLMHDRLMELVEDCSQ